MYMFKVSPVTRINFFRIIPKENTIISTVLLPMSPNSFKTQYIKNNKKTKKTDFSIDKLYT